MPRSMICVEAQMGRPSTCRTQMARKSILKPRGGLGSYQHPEDTPGTLSSAAWVHVGRAEKRSVSTLCALVVWAQLERVIAEGIGWEVTEHSSGASSSVGKLLEVSKLQGVWEPQNKGCLAWSPLSSPS